MYHTSSRVSSKWVFKNSQKRDEALEELNKTYPDTLFTTYWDLLFKKDGISFQKSGSVNYDMTIFAALRNLGGKDVVVTV